MNFKRVLVLSIIILISSNIFALKPDTTSYAYHPDSYGVLYKEYFIQTSDGVNLKSWVCTPKKDVDNKQTLILAYGDAGNMSYFLTQISKLVKSGFSVVAFDYRGFGESESFKINKDYLYYNEFSTDLVSVIRWTKNNLENNKTGIWALSMGTIMTTLALQEENVDFLIAEGFVVSPLKITQKIKELKNRDLLLPKGYDKYKNILMHLSVKTLLFAGNKDIVTTVDDSKFVKKLNVKNKLIEFEGNHLQGFKVLDSGARYISEIRQFID